MKRLAPLLCLSLLVGCVPPDEEENQGIAVGNPGVVAMSLAEAEEWTVTVAEASVEALGWKACSGADRLDTLQTTLDLTADPTDLSFPAWDWCGVVVRFAGPVELEATWSDGAGTGSLAATVTLPELQLGVVDDPLAVDEDTAWALELASPDWLDAAALGEQVRAAFFGALAMRQLRGTDEVEIRVQLPEAEREELQTLESFLVRTPDGTEVPLLDVAELRPSTAYASIERRDGRRVIRVSMDVEPKRAMGQVLNALRDDVLVPLRADHPGLTWVFQGAQAEMRESTGSLYWNFALALAVIYGLLAVAFRNYSQPVIVMAAIPFGAVGAVLGHVVLGYDLSLVSLMGMVALAGVVVNDALIMVFAANRLADDHAPVEAIRQAAVRRFRPILLTTLTTFGGLTPLILERSAQARHLIPMAISLGFGIVFATAIILVIVPCLYLVERDLAALRGAR